MIPFRSLRGPFPGITPGASILLVTSALAYGIGLENGEVVANSIQELGGKTTSAAQVLSMSAVAPPQTVPPPPPTFAPAVSTIQATMSRIDLSSSGSITGTFNQLGSSGTAQVDFRDNLIVTAEGIDPGTDLIVEITWNVNGAVEFTSTPNIKNRSKILVEADGIQLSPNDPIPPKQQWTRDRANFVNERFDEFGPVTFRYLLQAGTPDFDGNVVMRSVAGFLCGGPGSIFSGNYGASGSAELSVELVGVTNVQTTDGRTLYRWTTNSQSGLPYGSRDEDPPSDPELSVGPSALGPRFSTLSWQTIATEYYLVQASADGSQWQTVTEVLGTGGGVTIEVLNPAPAITYRLVTERGNGTPSPGLRLPVVHLLPVQDGAIRVAWQTNHWENYALNEIGFDGSKTLLHFVQGDGGASVFELPIEAPVRLVQVEAALK